MISKAYSQAIVQGLIDCDFDLGGLAKSTKISRATLEAVAGGELSFTAKQLKSINVQTGFSAGQLAATGSGDAELKSIMNQSADFRSSPSRVAKVVVSHKVSVGS